MLQGSPEETRRLYEAWAPQSQRNQQNSRSDTLKIGTETELSYEFSNTIDKNI